MNPIYKLTDSKDRTHPGAPNQCQWGAGVTHTAPDAAAYAAYAAARAAADASIDLAAIAAQVMT